MQRQKTKLLLLITILTLTISSAIEMQTQKRNLKSQLTNHKAKGSSYSGGSITYVEKGQIKYAPIKYTTTFDTNLKGINLSMDANATWNIKEHLFTDFICWKEMFSVNDNFAWFGKQSTHYIPYYNIKFATYGTNKYASKALTIKSRDGCSDIIINSVSNQLLLVYKQIEKKIGVDKCLNTLSH